MSTLDYNVQTPPDSITVPFLVSTGYYIKVKGFIVGGQTLNIPPEAISSTLHTFGKVIVDSGAVYSYLFPQAYEILREAFRKEAKNRLKRIYGSFSKFETCYDMEDWQVAIVPSMWIMFSDDKKLELNVLNYLHVYKPGVYCLAFLPSLKTDTNPYPQSIFGNTLLQTTRVTYDLVNMLLSFTPDSC
uniref:aspartic proteinase nepenthesin-2-like n=1 Tax=Erigeron canadensis TaxID=72917 RepID=UPI001CB9827A|nr:aspartic proteinase nepenthesin-2-like [Erigeron canadensis]